MLRAERAEISSDDVHSMKWAREVWITDVDVIARCEVKLLAIHALGSILGESMNEETPTLSSPSPRLHIGCGRESIPGWTNIDIQALEGVDVVLDASRSLPFREAEAVFAEHFLEHLRIDEALAFFQRAHRALRLDGWIRVSTPNLDWVLLTHYPGWAAGEQRALNALALNRAFHGWGHQFAWNFESLDLALRATGFQEIRLCRYGESTLSVFRDLEHHETYPDHPDAQHVLIAEGRKGSPRPELLSRVREVVRAEYLAHLDPLPKSVVTGED